jgi:hypothetical protein
MVDQKTNVETRTFAPLSQTIDNTPESLISPLTQWRRVRTLSEEIEFTRPPEAQQRWYDWITDIFKKPSAEKLAYREYEDSRRNLLQSQRMRDYYESMVRFEAQRIKRLRKVLGVA